MLPALAPGDYVVVDTRAYGRRSPGPGEVVLAHDPRDESRVVAKRVAGPDGADGVVLLGDNPDLSTDSRTFGPVRPADITGRILWRYWPPARFGPVR
jgi:nickel-type superoxide dismutase maturation protease